MFMNKRILNILYSAGFLFTIHTAFTAYIDSSFLSNFINEKFVGLIFTIGAILAIFFLNKISFILSKLGNFKTMIFLILLEMLSLAGLILFKNPWIIISLFIIHYGFLVLLKFNFDVFIEHFSKNSFTGGIRGAFLTVVNLAWVISPILVGYALNDSEFWKIYLMSSLILAPLLLIIYLNFKNIPDNHYYHPPFWKTLKEVLDNKNIRKIFMASFLLQFFFGWMVIYMPIYLKRHIGFSWGEIGVMFTIMLLPYILFELPLGKLADSRFGEKEFLTVGFLITALSTGIIAFLTSANLLVWIIILFITRIGASFIEITSESYFFKQINDTDVNVISFFRNTQPAAYIIAPVIATIILKFFAYQYLFLILAVIMLWGLRYSMTLRDTK